MTAPSGACRLAPLGFDGGRLRADWDAGVDLDIHPVPAGAPTSVSRLPLTARQQRILTFIAGYMDEHGCPPSQREIGAAVGLKSPSSVNYQVGQLAGRGLLERPADGCRARALKLIRGGVA